MAFTYDLSTRPGKVRLMIGDTDSTMELLSDEEIQVALDDTESNGEAAAICCTFIAGSFARKVSHSIDDVKIEAQQKYDHYKDLAAMFRTNPGALAGGIPRLRMFVGGISIAKRDDMLNDADRIQPNFRLGQDDIRGALNGPGDLDQRD